MASYMAHGYVCGNCWGGGTALYQSEIVFGKTRREIEDKIEAGIQDGTLDAGFGFESLIGAIMRIVETDQIIHKGKTYIREEADVKVFGKVPIRYLGSNIDSLFEEV